MSPDVITYANHHIVRENIYGFFVFYLLTMSFCFFLPPQFLLKFIKKDSNKTRLHCILHGIVIDISLNCSHSNTKHLAAILYGWWSLEVTFFCQNDVKYFSEILQNPLWVSTILKSQIDAVFRILKMQKPRNFKCFNLARAQILQF